MILTEKEIQEQLFCQQCSQEIYPGSWDDAIERVYAYQKKCFTPMRSGIKLKKKGKIVLGIALAFVLGGLSLWLSLGSTWQ